MRWRSDALVRPRHVLAAYIRQPRDDGLDGGPVQVLQSGVTETT